MSRVVSLIVLLAIIVVAGLLFYKVMVGFFVPVFLAAVLVVVFRPLHRWVLEKTSYREKLSAIITTVLIMLSVLVPTALVVSSAAVQATGLISRRAKLNADVVIDNLRSKLRLDREFSEELDECEKKVLEIFEAAEGIGKTDETETNDKLTILGEQLAASLARLRESVGKKHGLKFNDLFDKVEKEAVSIGQPQELESGFQRAASELSHDYGTLETGILGGPIFAPLIKLANPGKEQWKNLTAQAFDYIRPRLLSVTGATGSFLIHLVIGTAILIISVFFFLFDGPAMVKGLMSLSPLDDRYEEELLMEFDKISRAMVLATMLAAITQGLVAGLGYYVAGVPSLVLLVILTTVFAMIPFVGPPIVWIPVCLYLAFYQDRMGAAIGLAAWGVVVVGTIDNFVKAYVLHGQSQLHPLLALLSVLGGVQALGPIGIVVGPMIVALLQTLLSILQREMLHFEEHSLVVAKPATAQPQTKFRLKRRKPKVEPPSEPVSNTTADTDVNNPIEDSAAIES